MNNKSVEQLGFMLKSVSIYRDILEDEVFCGISKILTNECGSAYKTAEVYSDVFNLLCKSSFKGNLYDYIYDKVLYAENLFTLECSKGEFKKLPSYIIDAVKNDLAVFCEIANLSSQILKQHIAENFHEIKPLIEYLPNYSAKSSSFLEVLDWGKRIDHFIEHCVNNGYGFYSRYNFFYLDLDELKPVIKPVLNPDLISLQNLKGYESQRKTIRDNTLALISGIKANNMLLYGHRGTGKSSTVKAIVNEYQSSGLRLVEVSKENLKYLGRVIDILSKIPMKFIVFVDDLTFSDGDDSYTALKAVLEGSSNKLADNMALYATTNRRHLITETFSAREGDEVHLKDTLDETASLSDRFGITVTFSFPSRKEYLEIVEKLAFDANINIESQELEKGAVAWSARRGSFSPRTAKQYIDFAIAKQIQQ